MACPKCGATMNQHATKVDYAAGQQLPGAMDPDFHGVVQEVHQCAHCGNVELRASQGALATPAR
jgi:ribosomal protein S27AE